MKKETKNMIFIITGLAVVAGIALFFLLRKKAPEVRTSTTPPPGGNGGGNGGSGNNPAPSTEEEEEQEYTTISESTEDTPFKYTGSKKPLKDDKIALIQNNLNMILEVLKESDEKLTGTPIPITSVFDLRTKSLADIIFPLRKTRGLSLSDTRNRARALGITYL